jgi:nucleoside-diphosphate-sugar epimerase
MKKILITGCSGYIGSHLTKLLENEYEVHGLDIREPQHPVKEFNRIDINRLFAIEQEKKMKEMVELSFEDFRRISLNF